MGARAKATPKDRLWKLCEEFIADRDITCGETIWQTDRVMDEAEAFVEKICEIVGYAPGDPDTDEES